MRSRVGLPSIDADPDEVYRRTFPRTLAKNEQFFARFPHLQARVDRIADLLERDEVLMPGGDRLTVERFQTLGQSFGVEIGFDRVHWLLDEAFADEAERCSAKTFVNEVFIATATPSNPLYMVLQESIYGAGPPTGRPSASAPCTLSSTLPRGRCCALPAR